MRVVTGRKLTIARANECAGAGRGGAGRGARYDRAEAESLVSKSRDSKSDCENDGKPNDTFVAVQRPVLLYKRRDGEGRSPRSGRQYGRRAWR
jgi:hypothetical protein